MKYYVVDAFAEHLFEGNPAGVCVLNQWFSEELMQNIAMENNLSETAFCVREKEFASVNDLEMVTVEIKKSAHAYGLFLFRQD